jgi:uncharacterized membrane protein (UPF0127 family)
MRLIRAVALGIVVFAISGVAASDGPPLKLPADVQPVTFASGIVFIHTRSGEMHRLDVEIAETEAQRQRGLMYRTSMREESGMLFIFTEEREGGFWMFNTRIPLSVAYAGDDGVIFQVIDMKPCASRHAAVCARQDYPARAPFRYGLEVNQGFFARRGIDVGDRLEFLRE